MNIDALLAWLEAQLQNDFFSGGLALGAVGILSAVFARLVPLLRHFAVNRLFTTITVDNRTDTFAHLVSWLHRHPYTRRCRRLVLNQFRNGLDIDGHDDEPAIHFAPAPGNHFIFHGGVLLWVERTFEEGRSTDWRGRPDARETIKITALTRERAFLRRLIEDIAETERRKDGASIAVYGADSYGDWVKRASVAKRPLPSVVIPGEGGQKLLGDARRFLADHKWYETRGIPWRRGYLLFGPPGTGKTSLVKAIAGELELGIAMLNLAAPNLSDDNLCALMAEAPRNSLLLLEDVDAAFSKRKKGESNGNALTFSGLLNAIDGVMSQEGHLLFLTTNHADRLDPALIRPGRIDVRMEIGLAGPDEASHLFGLFYPGEGVRTREFGLIYGERYAAPSAIQDHFLRFREDPAAAVANVEELFPNNFRSRPLSKVKRKRHVLARNSWD